MSVYVNVSEEYTRYTAPSCCNWYYSESKNKNYSSAALLLLDRLRVQQEVCCLFDRKKCRAARLVSHHRVELFGVTFWVSIMGSWMDLDSWVMDHDYWH